MAAVQHRSGRYRVLFRYHGKQQTLNLGLVSRDEAKSKADQVRYLLMRSKQGAMKLPPGCEIVDFMRHDGNAPPKAEQQSVKKATRLEEIRDRYLATYSEANEPSTLKTARTHFRHLIATLGPGFPVADLKPLELQRHVNRRARAAMSPVTIRKEIATLGTAWNWAASAGIIDGAFSSRGVVFAKADEKPSFRTFEEIERQIRRGGLNEQEKEALWEGLFLGHLEIAAVLDHVKKHGRHPWIYPMVCFAAHTGARRSELVRARVADLDFEAETVLIRELKRDNTRRTTRRAPLSPFLANVLKAWLAEHPGGPYLFCHCAHVARSRTRSRTAQRKHGPVSPTSLEPAAGPARLGDRPAFSPLTAKEAHDHLERTLRGSSWAVLCGWHVLRHSFISCCAAAGVDQRVIDDWVGHTTEDMRKRYRHLFPSTRRRAIRAVFG